MAQMETLSWRYDHHDPKVLLCHSQLGHFVHLSQTGDDLLEYQITAVRLSQVLSESFVSHLHATDCYLRIFHMASLYQTD